jgi:hypothetical protein
MSSFESNCSVKKRKRRRNRRRSGQVATKTKAKQAAARTINTTIIKTQTTTTTTHTYSVSPNLRNKYVTETCRIFYMRLLRLRPALPTSLPHSRAGIINDLITKVEVQILCLLCPRLKQSRNDHSVEKVVVSRGQNTPVLLRTEKYTAKSNLKPIGYCMYRLTSHRITLQFAYTLCLCFVRLSEYTTFIFLPSLNRFVWNCPHSVFYATELNSYILMMHYMFQDHAMDHVVSYCTFTAENQARSQASLCVICSGQIGNGAGYPPGNSATTCH